MKSQIQKWGNSLAVRIPRAFAEEIGLSQGCHVEMTVEDGRLIVCPAKAERPTLAELLAEVTPENRHAEVDFGPPVGREFW
jgi:antitoxin MazE